MLIALLFFLPWGGRRDLWFPDEPDVAEPAISMVESGDWLVPRRNDEPWLDYPPLTYWLGAASARLLGGPSPFALRLPVGLIAVLLVALTGLSVDRLAGRSAGLWAGVTLATAPHFVYQAINFHPDMAFAALTAGGLAAYAWGVRRWTGWRTVGLRSFGFACLGAAILAKGPLGLLLPGLILVVWHASLRQWRALFWMGPLSLIAVAVAAPWYLLLTDAISGEFVWREFYLQNFSRFSDSTRGHEQPWHYYLGAIVGDWGPWCLLLPGALLTAARRDWSRPLPRLALLWFLVSLLFLTAATTKRQVYLLPAYPAMAFLIGRHAALLIDEGRARLSRWLLIGFGGAGVLAGAAVPAGLLLGIDLGLDPAKVATALGAVAELAVPVALLCAAFVLGGLLVARFAWRGVTQGTLACVAAMLATIYLISVLGFMSHIDHQRSYRPAALWLRQQSASRPIGYYLPGAELKMSGIRVNDPAFLPLATLATPGEAARFLEDERNVVVARAERAGEIAPLVADWEALPKRELSLSRAPFLALGPLRQVTNR